MEEMKEKNLSILFIFVICVYLVDEISIQESIQ